MDDWDWKGKKPKEWRPTVKKLNDKVVVEFYTYTNFDGAGISRHSDSFSPDSYCFKSDTKKIAESGGGCVY